MTKNAYVPFATRVELAHKGMVQAAAAFPEGRGVRGRDLKDRLRNAASYYRPNVELAKKHGEVFSLIVSGNERLLVDAGRQWGKTIRNFVRFCAEGKLPSRREAIIAVAMLRGMMHAVPVEDVIAVGEAASPGCSKGMGKQVFDLLVSLGAIRYYQHGRVYPAYEHILVKAANN